MASSYFDRLNYSLANEDTRMELAMLPSGAHVLAVAGSGGRVLPLLAKAPRRLVCVDVAQEQLWLTELRVACLRAFSHAEYLRFWGYPSNTVDAADTAERRALFARLQLGPAAADFCRGLFEASGWGSVLYQGRWERTFAGLSRVNRLLTGARGAGLFDCRTLAEQQDYLRTRFPRRAWKALLFLVGNRAVFNALLYHGNFPRKNLPVSYLRFYTERFDRLFAHGVARENFFLQLAFFGALRFAEGLPVECDPDVYAQAQAGLGGCEMRYVCGDVVAQAASERLDFVSLSDVASYFGGPRETGFMDELSEGLNPGARVVVRSYLRVPMGVRRASASNYQVVTGAYQEAIDAERVGVYDVEVLQWNG